MFLFSNWYLEHFLQNCHHVPQNLTDLSSGLVPSGNKLPPEPMLSNSLSFRPVQNQWLKSIPHSSNCQWCSWWLAVESAPWTPKWSKSFIQITQNIHTKWLTIIPGKISKLWHIKLAVHFFTLMNNTKQQMKFITSTDQGHNSQLSLTFLGH